MNRATTSSPEESWLQNCQQGLQDNGCRLTASRLAVVETIAASRRVLTPFDIFEQARQRSPGLGLVTVYRTLEKLEELDLVQRVHQPAGCQAFIAAFSGHQHLLICTGCGRAEFFSGENERMDGLITQVADASGYQVHDHWLQLFGRCNECRSLTG